MAEHKQTEIECKKDTIHGVFLRKKLSTEEQSFYSQWENQHYS